LETDKQRGLCSSLGAILNTAITSIHKILDLQSSTKDIFTKKFWDIVIRFNNVDKIHSEPSVNVIESTIIGLTEFISSVEVEVVNLSR
jgi:uncharacterized protein YsxB (DUF464 family)